MTREELVRVARRSRSVRQQKRISELEAALEKPGTYLTPRGGSAATEMTAGSFCHSPLCAPTTSSL